jgi:hypothetical protein
VTNPFKQFGISHLSASSLNLFKAEPAFWSLKYLHGVKDELSAAPLSGIAVESGLDVFLMGAQDEDDRDENGVSTHKGNVDKAVLAAQHNYRLNTLGEVTDEIEKRQLLIEPMVRQACAGVRGAGELLARQIKIETWLEGIDIPVIGYVDYSTEHFDMDLKTTLRIPSAPRADHLRQVSIYAHARGKPQRLFYVSDKRNVMYMPSEADLAAAFLEVTRIARNLRKLLSVSESRAEFNEFLTPDYESFYWDEKTTATAKEIFR